MSKPVKELIRKELQQRLEGVTSLAVVGFTGLDAVATNRVRGRLLEKSIRMTVVRNALARQAFRQVGLDGAVGLLDGPCAITYSLDADQGALITMVRELKAIGKEFPALTVKAALMDGDVYQGEEDVTALSRYPTREEALSQLLGSILSPASSVASCIVAPGGQVASLIQAIEEKAGEGAGEAAPAAA
jgi:large subunit ribosomal protein L10